MGNWRNRVFPSLATAGALLGGFAAEAATYPVEAVYSCSAHSEGPHEETMIADVLTTADGTPVLIRGTWRPPQPDVTERDFKVPLLLLGIEVEQPMGGTDEKPWRYRATASLSPESPEDKDRTGLVKRLATYRLDYDYDDGPPRAGALAAQPYDPNWSGLVEAAADLPQPPAGAKALTLRLVSAKGTVVAMVTYAIGDTSGRQRLFENTKLLALAMTRSPHECWRIER